MDVFNVSCLFSLTTAPGVHGYVLMLLANRCQSEIISHFWPSMGRCSPVWLIVTPVMEGSRLPFTTTSGVPHLMAKITLLFVQLWPICNVILGIVSHGLEAIHWKLLNIEAIWTFLSERVVDRWNKLDQRDIDCGSIKGFRNRLEGIRKTRIVFFMD